MNKKIEVSIFDWFCECLQLATGEMVSGKPFDAMKKVGAPVKKYPWLKQVENNLYQIENKRGIPELEARDRQLKRQTGQFYTPVSFVKLLLKNEQFYKKQLILDPACGSGNFLIPILEVFNDLGFGFESIYGYDLDAQALLVCLGRSIVISKAKSWPNLELRNFLHENQSIKFNLIVGNPPYKVNLSASEKSKLVEKFTTAEGEKDLYTFFIEASINMLQPSGKLIMLTSHTYLVNKQCQKIRDYIFRENNATALYFLDYRFFIHAPGVLPVVLSLTNQKVTNKIVKLYSHFSYENGWSECIETHSQELCSPSGLRRAFIPDKLMHLFLHMEKSKINLGEICKIRVGIQEASKRGAVISKFVSNVKKNSSYKPVLKGREISPFGINWEGKYIHYGKHLTYAGDPNIYEQAKVLYQNIRNEKLAIRLVATIDYDSYYPKNSLTTISEVSNQFSLEFILGILNSRLINIWFSGNYFSFHITVTQVKTIPLPEFNEKLVAEIEDTVKQIIRRKKDGLETTNLIDNMNLLVYKIYFPQNNLEEVDKICHNCLEQMSRL